MLGAPPARPSRACWAKRFPSLVVLDRLPFIVAALQRPRSNLRRPLKWQNIERKSLTSWSLALNAHAHAPQWSAQPPWWDANADGRHCKCVRRAMGNCTRCSRKILPIASRMPSNLMTRENCDYKQKTTLPAPIYPMQLIDSRGICTRAYGEKKLNSKRTRNAPLVNRNQRKHINSPAWPLHRLGLS